MMAQASSAEFAAAVSPVTLRRVEARTHLSEEYQKDKAQYKKRTMTIEDIHHKYPQMLIS